MHVVSTSKCDNSGAVATVNSHMLCEVSFYSEMVKKKHHRTFFALISHKLAIIYQQPYVLCIWAFVQNIYTMFDTMMT